MLYNAFSKPAPAPRLDEHLRHAGYAQRVLRYELYDAKGDLSSPAASPGCGSDENAIERVGARLAVQLLEAESKAGKAQIATSARCRSPSAANRAEP